MSSLLDLPLEIRLKILAYLWIYESPPYWRSLSGHPIISLVNRQLRHESLDAFYRWYRWSLCIALAQDGSTAATNYEMIRYFQAMRRGDQLWRLHKMRITFTLPKVTSFTLLGLEEGMLPFDAQDPDRPSFYKTLGKILCQAKNLRRIEITWFGSDWEGKLNTYSRGCRQLTTFLPRTCEYRVMPYGYNNCSPQLKRYVDSIQEAMTQSAEVLDVSDGSIHTDLA